MKILKVYNFIINITRLQLFLERSPQTAFLLQATPTVLLMEGQTELMETV